MPQFELYWFSSQIFWVLLCFSTVFLFVKKYVIPRIEEGISKRNDLLNFYVEDAKKINLKTEKIMKSYALEVNKVEQETKEIVSKVHRKIEEKFSKEEAKLNLEFSNKIERAEKEYHLQSEEKRTLLSQKSKKLALRISIKMMGNKK
ncbi:MAG: hypothetical protein EOM53_02335 [Alphaproteobacteria bacterium]|nr:hypothetical protein [Alphaproteobacteria bacterium]